MESSLRSCTLSQYHYCYYSRSFYYLFIPVISSPELKSHIRSFSFYILSFPALKEADLLYLEVNQLVIPCELALYSC